jgi:HD-like signal output (HDOD) protein
LHEAEQRLLEVDHCQAGAWLAEGWQMPEPLISAIANHHGTAEDSEASGELVVMVRLADLAAANVDRGLAGEPKASEQLLESLGISETQYLQVLEQLEASRDDIEAFFNLV